MNIIDLTPTDLKRVASTNGGEYHGPCPWCGGRNRFCVWPEEGETGRYWCRRCERGGDGIQLLRDLRGKTFREAKQAFGLPADRNLTYEVMPKTTDPPPKAWQDAAWSFAQECEARLWAEDGAKALAWLRGRGLTDTAIKRVSFGFNSDEIYLGPPAWGAEKGVKIERGIIMPWVIDGQLWKLNVRRSSGAPKYKCVSGSRNALYNADVIRPGKPIVLVEGEIDAWSVIQQAHEIAWAVATGSTHGSRRAKWIARLIACSVVLVAFDSDEPGEDAATYWTDNLPNANRWRPYWSDVNQMLQDGADLFAWVQAGIQQREAA